MSNLLKNVFKKKEGQQDMIEEIDEGNLDEEENDTV